MILLQTTPAQGHLAKRSNIRIRVIEPIEQMVVANHLRRWSQGQNGLSSNYRRIISQERHDFCQQVDVGTLSQSDREQAVHLASISQATLGQFPARIKKYGLCRSLLGGRRLQYFG